MDLLLGLVSHFIFCWPSCPAAEARKLHAPLEVLRLLYSRVCVFLCTRVVWLPCRVVFVSRVPIVVAALALASSHNDLPMNHQESAIDALSAIPVVKFGFCFRPIGEALFQAWMNEGPRILNQISVVNRPKSIGREQAMHLLVDEPADR